MVHVVYMFRCFVVLLLKKNMLRRVFNKKMFLEIYAFRLITNNEIEIYYKQTMIIIRAKNAAYLFSFAQRKKESARQWKYTRERGKYF